MDYLITEEGKRWLGAQGWTAARSAALHFAHKELAEAWLAKIAMSPLVRNRTVSVAEAPQDATNEGFVYAPPSVGSDFDPFADG
jgi:hypothetical protein